MAQSPESSSEEKKKRSVSADLLVGARPPNEKDETERGRKIRSVLIKGEGTDAEARVFTVQEGTLSDQHARVLGLMPRVKGHADQVRLRAPGKGTVHPLLSCVQAGVIQPCSFRLRLPTTRAGDQDLPVLLDQYLEQVELARKSLDRRTVRSAARQSKSAGAKTSQAGAEVSADTPGIEPEPSVRKSAEGTPGDGPVLHGAHEVLSIGQAIAIMPGLDPVTGENFASRSPFTVADMTQPWAALVMVDGFGPEGVAIRDLPHAVLSAIQTHGDGFARTTALQLQEEVETAIRVKANATAVWNICSHAAQGLKIAPRRRVASRKKRGVDHHAPTRTEDAALLITEILMDIELAAETRSQLAEMLLGLPAWATELYNRLGDFVAEAVQGADGPEQGLSGGCVSAHGTDTPTRRASARARTQSAVPTDSTPDLKELGARFDSSLATVNAWCARVGSIELTGQMGLLASPRETRSMFLSSQQVSRAASYQVMCIENPKMGVFALGLLYILGGGTNRWPMLAMKWLDKFLDGNKLLPAEQPDSHDWLIGDDDRESRTVVSALVN